MVSNLVRVTMKRRIGKKVPLRFVENGNRRECIMTKGYIYIMTNPALKDVVKIGYATDVESRQNS